MKTVVNIHWAGKRDNTVRVWLTTLSKTEKEELARLDYQSQLDLTAELIARDWIEEHGGERDYWDCILTEDD